MEDVNDTHSSQVWSLILVVLVPVACLAPFVTKAFHIDDTLFLWTAKQILSHPMDFYGFSANWYGHEMPMSVIQQNPPLTAYFIALGALLSGWSEIAVHAGFLLFAVASSVGTYYLARRFCKMPHVAALTAVLSPAFLVSSTNVMSDVAMLAFYVWAIFLWMRGLEEKRPLSLALSAVCMSLSALTKYYGITVVPLVLIYSLVVERGCRRKLLYLSVPLGIMAGYECLTHVLYGVGLFSKAASYAVVIGAKQGMQSVANGLTGLSFVGGSLISAAFFAPFIKSRRWWILIVSLFPACVGVLLAIGRIGPLSLYDGENIRWLSLLPLAVFVVAGIHILALAVADFLLTRTPESLLLLLWVLGTFLFASFFNWTTNARTMLPMTPAVGILAVRRFESDTGSCGSIMPLRAFVPLAFASGLSLCVTWADFTLANCQQAAVEVIRTQLTGHPGQVWYQGHWGFQYYMQSIGGKSLDVTGSELKHGDMVIVPKNNCNVRKLPTETFRKVGQVELQPCQWLATVYVPLGAGFYSSAWGPLPYAVGAVGPEVYEVYQAVSSNTAPK